MHHQAVIMVKAKCVSTGGHFAHSTRTCTRFNAALAAHSAGEYSLYSLQQSIGRWEQGWVEKMVC